MRKKIFLLSILLFVGCLAFATEGPRTADVIFSGKQYVSCVFSISEVTAGKVDSSPLPSSDFKPKGFAANGDIIYETDPFYLNSRVCSISPVTISIKAASLQEYENITDTSPVANSKVIDWKNISERNEWKSVANAPVNSSGDGTEYTLISEESNDLYPRNYSWQFILQLTVPSSYTGYYKGAISIDVEVKE